MLKVLKGESLNSYKKKNRDRTTKNYGKYAQLKRFHHDHQIQIYMYYFIYEDPETMSVEYNFPATKDCFLSYKKMSTPGPVPKHWLGFSYIT